MVVLQLMNSDIENEYPAFTLAWQCKQLLADIGCEATSVSSLPCFTQASTEVLVIMLRLKLQLEFQVLC